MPKRNAKVSAKRSSLEKKSTSKNSKKSFNVPKPVKMGLLLVLLFAALVAVESFYQTPESKFVTGNVVVEQPEEQEEAEKTQPEPILEYIVYTGPEAGSTQSTPFSVTVDLPDSTYTCYYGAKDDGKLTYDRRRRSCPTEFVIDSGICGPGTCTVFYNAHAGDGRLIDTKEINFKVQ